MLNDATVAEYGRDAESRQKERQLTTAERRARPSRRKKRAQFTYLTVCGETVIGYLY